MTLGKFPNMPIRAVKRKLRFGEGDKPKRYQLSPAVTDECAVYECGLTFDIVIDQERGQCMPSSALRSCILARNFSVPGLAGTVSSAAHRA